MNPPSGPGSAGSPSTQPGITGVVEFDKRHDPVWGPGKVTGLAVQWQDGEKVTFWPPQVKGARPFRMPAAK